MAAARKKGAAKRRLRTLRLTERVSAKAVLSAHRFTAPRSARKTRPEFKVTNIRRQQDVCIQTTSGWSEPQDLQMVVKIQPKKTPTSSRPSLSYMNLDGNMSHDGSSTDSSSGYEQESEEDVLTTKASQPELDREFRGYPSTDEETAGDEESQVFHSHKKDKEHQAEAMQQQSQVLEAKTPSPPRPRTPPAMQLSPVQAIRTIWSQDTQVARPSGKDDNYNALIHAAQLLEPTQLPVRQVQSAEPVPGSSWMTDPPQRPRQFASSDREDVALQMALEASLRDMRPPMENADSSEARLLMPPPDALTDRVMKVIVNRRMQNPEVSVGKDKDYFPSRQRKLPTSANRHVLPLMPLPEPIVQIREVPASASTATSLDGNRHGLVGRKDTRVKAKGRREASVTSRPPIGPPIVIQLDGDTEDITDKENIATSSDLEIENLTTSGSEPEANSDSEGDPTDYSDDEDIRNHFGDVNPEDRKRAREHVLLAPLPKRRRQDNGFWRALPKEKFDKIVSDHHRQLMDAMKAESPVEEMPENIRELLHFPDRNMVHDDPEKAFRRLLTKGAKHHIPIKYMEITWEIVCDLFEVFTSERPRGFHRLRELELQALPGCTLYYTLEHRRTHTIHYVSSAKFKKKTYPVNKYRSLVCETRADLKELLEYHAERHNGPVGHEMKLTVERSEPICIHGYVDGVTPTSTGSWKMLCQVIRHNCCNLILNYSTFIYDKDYQLTPEQIMEGLIADLNRYPNVRLGLLICDMPERMRLCGLTNHNGEHGCLTCISPGEKRDGAPGRIWPPWTTTGQLRDDASFLNLAVASQITGLTVGGQKTSTPLVHIPGFSIVHGVPIDPMHLFAGLSKMLWERLAKTFLKRKQIKEMTDAISELYLGLDLPSDFKREKRRIDPPHFRANEWKQLVALCGVDIGLKYHEMGFPDVCKVWHKYTYVMRMLAQGDIWYRHSSYEGDLLKAEIQILYGLVEKLLGKSGCVPNLHALWHLPMWRQRYRLGVISTEKAEDFYGKNRKSFAQQTVSVGKQIHYNTLLAGLEGHACDTTFKFRPRAKAGDMDHVLVDAAKVAWYYVGDADDQDCYLAREICCVKYFTEETGIDWDAVGIYEIVGMEEDVTLVPKSNIIAKGIIIRDKLLNVWTKDLQDF